MAHRHSAVLCLGSNVGDRTENIFSALRSIMSIAEIEDSSVLAESDDITGKAGAYLNMVVRCSTAIGMNEFCRHLAMFECQGGRSADSKETGNVKIDIDLVVWDDDIISEDDYERPYFRELFGGLVEISALNEKS